METITQSLLPSEALSCQEQGMVRSGSQRKAFHFVLFCAVIFTLYHRVFMELIKFAISSDLFLYTLVVPCVSGSIIWIRRDKIFSAGEGYIPGSIVCGAAGFLAYLYLQGRLSSLPAQDRLAALTFLAVLTWVVGAFLFIGPRAARDIVFPLGFLLLMVPIPTMALDRLILFLQQGSTQMAEWLFWLSGAPVKRDGFLFSLSNLQISVAPECSGIRSSIYLFFFSIILGQFFLSTIFGKTILGLAVIPITIFKNGLRIITLALLGNYVSADILSSDLHRKGGIPFFALAMALMAFVVWGLKRIEQSKFFREQRESSP